MKLSRQEANQLLSEGLDMSSTRAKVMIYEECEEIADHIDRNFRRLQISPYGNKFSGNLARSLHWAVFNGSGGNIKLCTFYVLTYHKFVELSVQKGYKLSNGGMPGEIPGPNYGRIAVHRKRGNHVLNRKAAPFIGGEIRLHARSLIARLTRFFGYNAGYVLLSRILPEGTSFSDDIVFKNTTPLSTYASE